MRLMPGLALGPALARIGGGSRIRTGDILLAKQTLYQLSYTPRGRMVGLTRIELVTSSLSGTRSNQLSYKPLVSGRETEHFLEQNCLRDVSTSPLEGASP